MSVIVLVVSGWSNSGKSTFTQWLADKHGFDRIDIDEIALSSTPNPRVIVLLGLAQAGKASDLVANLRASSVDTVVDWPYNPPAHAFFQDVLALGLPCWWFDADRAQARSSFLSRKRRSVTEFDTHVGAIVAHKAQLTTVYGARHLRTLHMSGVRLQHVDIWDYVRSIEGWMPG